MIFQIEVGVGVLLVLRFISAAIWELRRIARAVESINTELHFEVLSKLEDIHIKASDDNDAIIGVLREVQEELKAERFYEKLNSSN